MPVPLTATNLGRLRLSAVDVESLSDFDMRFARPYPSRHFRSRFFGDSLGHLLVSLGRRPD